MPSHLALAKAGLATPASLPELGAMQMAEPTLGSPVAQLAEGPGISICDQLGELYLQPGCGIRELGPALPQSSDGQAPRNLQVPRPLQSL